MSKIPVFHNCEKCGKRLIEKRKDGQWYFAFGKSNEVPNVVPVEMYIVGSIRIKCLRKSCGHWNTLNPFPEMGDSDGNEHKTISGRPEQVCQ